MNDSCPNPTRRRLLKTAGLAGLGAVIGPLTAGSSPRAALQTATDQIEKVSTRPFGRTGQQVSMLSLGGMFDVPNNQLLLRQAVKWGVTYWDTANSYGGGRSEKGIGKYFRRYPEDRPKIFLVTKSGAWSTGGMTRHLDKSLGRMQTDYIDLFFVHSIRSIDEMDDDKRRWAEDAKASGKIKYFGFSTHSNMAACLSGAASLDWIDGIMMTYNYRLMHQKDMQAAVDACTGAGIGLTAMKTQGGGPVSTHTDTEMKMAGRFLNQGFTDGQAKLKAVWENAQIASICSQMPTLSLLMGNVAAALNRTRLSSEDKRYLQAFAHETASGYCAGCTALCEAAVSAPIPIGDIMRYLMYRHSYGDVQRARRGYRRIPRPIRRQIDRTDFSQAEAACPQRLAIGRMMRSAAKELA